MVHAVHLAAAEEAELVRDAREVLPVLRHVRAALAALAELERALHVVALAAFHRGLLFCRSRTNSWRCSSASFGFGSKVSMCDGPPSIIRKMQFFAFAGKCPAFGASGFLFSSAASSDVNATLPRLAPSQ